MFNFFKNIFLDESTLKRTFDFQIKEPDNGKKIKMSNERERESDTLETKRSSVLIIDGSYFETVKKNYEDTTDKTVDMELLISNIQSSIGKKIDKIFYFRGLLNTSNHSSKIIISGDNTIYCGYLQVKIFNIFFLLFYFFLTFLFFLKNKIT